jgi:DNA-binding IscR family transcriptional regulator
MNDEPKTVTVAELCQLNDISVAQAEKALANLQAKGLVSGYVAGDLHAKITLTADAEQYVG